MALSLSLPFPVTSKRKPHPKLDSRITSPANFGVRTLHRLKFNSINIERRRHRHSAAAGDGEAESDSTTSELNEEREQKSSESVEASDLGAEIKKAMREKEEREKGGGGGGGDLWSGVLEEIGEIEWPVFGNVLGTTGVVLGVIAGSSVVLLTVNAVLAELSDSIFAGKGVLDFFG